MSVNHVVRWRETSATQIWELFDCVRWKLAETCEISTQKFISYLTVMENRKISQIFQIDSQDLLLFVQLIKIKFYFINKILD